MNPRARNLLAILLGILSISTFVWMIWAIIRWHPLASLAIFAALGFAAAAFLLYAGRGSDAVPKAPSQEPAQTREEAVGDPPRREGTGGGYCTHCGSPLDPSSTYCGACGRRLRAWA